MLKRLMSCLCAAVIVLAAAPALSFADEADESVYYIGFAVNAGLDTGYSESAEFSRGDWHFGWELGRFAITGYTSMTEDEQGRPVFLKTAGDEIKLSFKLSQDIDALNGSENLSINADTDGYNQYFGIDRTDFGRGTLIIRQTNYQNATSEPQVYTDYLEGIEVGADTEVVLLEEGNYEVQLDYEVRNDPRRVGPLSLVPEYANYKIDFYFEVRNGNCMVFPFDLATRSELTNEAYAPNGFYLDLAKSRYLDINVKKEMLAEGANGLVEDTRFNKPAKDGDEYTEEGIYTITASNPSTGQETIKKIYVGNNPVLKCCAVTGLPLETINARLAEGDTIDSDGALAASKPVAPEGPKMKRAESDRLPLGLIAAITVVVLISFVVALLRRQRKHRVSKEGIKQLDAAPQDPKLLNDNEEGNR